jgi:hypothetical protein
VALYQSELTQFMREFFEQHPEEKTAQLEGHLLLWNKKPISPEERERREESTVKQKPYPYQTDES